jgi:hypothetical protein
VCNLTTVVDGQGSKSFSKQTLDEIRDYDILKMCILQVYELVPEAYRKWFRGCTKRPKDSFTDFAIYMATNFERWLRSVNADTDIDQLKQVILLEQFYECINDDSMVAYLKDCSLSTLVDVARKADEYALLHKRSGQSASKAYGYSKRTASIWSDKDNGSKDSNRSGDSGASGRRPNFVDREGPIICFNCRKPGHTKTNCPELSNAAVRWVAPSDAIDGIEVGAEAGEEIKQYAKAEPAEHIYPVVVHGSGDCIHVMALRNTGASVCLLKEGSVPLGYLTPINQTIELKGFYGDAKHSPLYSMHVASSIVRGSIVVALSQAGCNWTVGVSLIVGNDYGVRFGPVETPNSESAGRTDGSMTSDISTKAGSSEGGGDLPLTAIVTRRQARQL